MQRRTKRTVKVVIFSIIGLLLTFFAGVALLINLVFTPEKVTPIIVRVLNNNLHAQVACERVELTFFSTFPNFGVKMENGSVVSKALKGNYNDTLATFSLCSATFDVSKLLRKKSLEIKHLTLKEPQINSIIDSSGTANWNILKPSEPDTLEEASFEIKSYVLKAFTIENATLSYSDVVGQTVAQVSGYNMELEAANNDQEMVLAVSADSKRTSLSQSGMTFIKNLKTSFKTGIHLNKKTHKMQLTDGTVKLNDIDFLINGDFLLDSAKKQVQMAVKMELKVPSLRTLWENIPTNLIQKEDIDVHGKAALTMTAEGVYGRGKHPLTTVTLNIKEGAVKYKKYPGEIKKLEADISTSLDFNKMAHSTVNVRQLKIEGTGINLEGNALLTNIIDNPTVSSDIKASLDLNTIQKAYPLSQGLKIGGQAALNLSVGFRVNEVKNFKFQNLRLTGQATLQNLLVDSPADSLYFNTQKTELALTGDGITKGKKDVGQVRVSKLKATYKKQHDLSIEGLDLNLDAEALSGNRAVLKAGAKVNSLKYVAEGGMKAVFRKAQVTASLSPGLLKNSPAIRMDLSVDSAAMWQGKQYVGMQNGNYNFHLSKSQKGRWVPKGHVEFNNLRAFTPEFPLPLHMAHSRVEIDNRTIILNNAHIKAGKSDVTMTGRIANIMALRRAATDTIKAHIRLRAEYIDANEIMMVLHKASEKTAEMEKSAVPDTPKQDTATTEKAVFRIPKNINFAFVSSVKALKLGKMDITNAKGLLLLKDGTVKLRNFNLETLAAKLSTTLLYQPKSEKTAQVNFKFNLEEIQMDRLSEFMPALDSLLPMAHSFEGKVNFRMQGTMQLDEKMEVIIPSLRSIAALQAKDIMLMDSETFRELAKTLKFKSKEKNNIKTLDMEMLIEKSHMEVLPALVEIDRYKVAVGGIQNMDLTYDYHISVLDSPIPFKTGVDIKGDVDDYKIRLSKAKYKYYFTDKERLKEKADTTVMYKKQAILDRLQF